MIRGVLLAYISISLFLSQAKMPLFTHICHGMGMTWTALVKPPKACCNKQKRKVHTSHCQKIQTASTVAYDQMPCCEDHIKYVSLSVQLIQQAVKASAQHHSTFTATPSLAYLHSIPFTPAHEVILQDHGPPEKPSGRDLLIAHGLLLC
jgi:hypothetical protein